MTEKLEKILFMQAIQQAHSDLLIEYHNQGLITFKELENEFERRNESALAGVRAGEESLDSRIDRLNTRIEKIGRKHRSQYRARVSGR